MTTLAITTQVSNPDTEDRRAMLYLIDSENKRRTALNNAVPPPDPLWPMLPTSTAAERKASYETVLNKILVSAHASYIKQAIEVADQDVQFKELRPGWVDASEATKNQVRALLGV